MSSVLMLKQMADRIEGKVTDQMDLNVNATIQSATVASATSLTSSDGTTCPGTPLE
jgi:hypothetical protein